MITLKSIHNKLMAALCCYVMLLAPCSAQAQDKQLLILHTNDTHSCIMPLKETLADTAVAGRGGYLRRLALIKQERLKNPQLLLFDSGDFSQGSAYYTLYKGDVEVDLMNQMGYDAATIGNHEYDNGQDELARRLSKAKFPTVCCNYDFTGTPLEGLVEPYVIVKRGGFKIGIIGATVRLAGVVAASSRNVDFIIGGHSHTFLKDAVEVENLDGELVPIMQAGCKGIEIGELKIY